MVAILVVCFSAMGAGNGAVFQLVPLRFKSMTPVAGSLVGEVGALGGGFLPVAMGISMQSTGSFALGFLAGAALAVVVLAALSYATRQWTTTWVGAGGKALTAERSGAAGAPAAEGGFLPAALDASAVVAAAGK
jgi:NNP family nitrate/nitrite transporter-like MFS transporter